MAVIEETLAQYGGLGAVILFFMGTFTWILKYITSDLKTTIQNNTEAIKDMKSIIMKCPNVYNQV